MRRLVPLPLVLGLLAAAGAASAQQAAPVVRLVGAPPPVSFVENGVTQTGFTVLPEAPLKLATTGSLTVIVRARPISDTAAKPVVLRILVTGTSGEALPPTRETLKPDPAKLVTIPGGLSISSAHVLAVQITLPAATVELAIEEGPGAFVTFSRTAPVRATSTSSAPAKPEPTPAAAYVSMIHKSIEHLSVGPRLGAFVPMGPARMRFGTTDGVFLGGEVRFTLPMLERLISVGLEAGTYELRQSSAAVAQGPFGPSQSVGIDDTVRVTPVIAGILVKRPLGDRDSLYLGAGGGLSVTALTRRIDLREPRSFSGSAAAVEVRAGFERKAGRGRALSFETSYLHVEAKPNERYLGGFMVGLQYRFVY